jgi:hypothetical protein
MREAAESKGTATKDDWLFRRDGAKFVPGPFAVGPWDPNLLQGSAFGALMATALEKSGLAAGWLTARLTFDMWRPVARATFAIEVSVLRDGKKARSAEIKLDQDGRTAIRCTALLLRRERSSIAGAPATADSLEPSGEPIAAWEQAMSPFFTGVEVRVLRGGVTKPGPAAAWLHLRRPLLDGEAASPLAQAVAAADLVAGISQLAHPRELGFVNSDLTLSLWRPPADEWILLDAATEAGPFGTGLASGRLSDRRGGFGHCSASLLFERRG